MEILVLLLFCSITGHWSLLKQVNPVDKLHLYILRARFNTECLLGVSSLQDI
jgi:hypothetical protein